MSKDFWFGFFKSYKIDSKSSHEFAEIFSRNSIRLECLDEIDRSVLKEMGITAIGDQMIIIKRIKQHLNSESKHSSL